MFSRCTCIAKIKFLGQGVSKLEPERDTDTLFCCCDLDLDPVTLMYIIDPDILKM